MYEEEEGEDCGGSAIDPVARHAETEVEEREICSSLQELIVKLDLGVYLGVSLPKWPV